MGFISANFSSTILLSVDFLKYVNAKSLLQSGLYVPSRVFIASYSGYSFSILSASSFGLSISVNFTEPPPPPVASNTC